jgi:hypothetical protein
MMPVERIIPEVMKAEQQPKTEVEAASKVCTTCGHDNSGDTRCKCIQAKAKETARFENVVEGACPSCGTQMRLSSANGIPVHVCMQHSVVMPLRDPAPIGAKKE